MGNFKVRLEHLRPSALRHGLTEDLRGDAGGTGCGVAIASRKAVQDVGRECFCVAKVPVQTGERCRGYRRREGPVLFDRIRRRDRGTEAVPSRRQRVAFGERDVLSPPKDWQLRDAVGRRVLRHEVEHASIHIWIRRGMISTLNVVRAGAVTRARARVLNIIQGLYGIRARCRLRRFRRRRVSARAAQRFL
ncbi:hypothetical protein APX01_06720 [Cereibacter sphaeroides]|nr:hypothetical protein APX01_06720 [Cereibacter sphaeroides]ANS33948.1 hypothetical protein A3858_06740 [Cereibacter sphaeroides]ATN62992.1 hypothetical protein A3857_06735 [Cereibacter sphaeroides]